MRILHVTPTYMPATRYGGPIYSVHGLARAQARRGDEVRVFTTNVDGDGVSDVALASQVDVDGVPVFYFPCGFGRRLYRSPRMAAPLETAVNDVDIVHVHAAFLWPTLAAARIAAKRNTPFVYAPRGMLQPDLIRAKSRVLKSMWIELFERRTVADAAALHVTSAAERDGVLALGLKPQHIEIVANGIDLPQVAADEGAEPPRILCLGRISWKKGLDRLIRAFAQTKGAELVIAGNDDEGLTPKLEALAHELGVAERVRICGAVHGEDKVRLVRSASLFALASHSENFGNVVLEAMACGLPVVVTPQVGLAQTIEETGCGRVAEGDPHAFGATLNELLDDPQRRRMMGAAGRGVTESRFSWRAIADEMDALYRDIMR